MVCVSQDDFKRWFLAKVRVMLAPGRDPFDSLETQTTPPMANGHSPHPSDGFTQELIRKYAEYQPTQVITRDGTHNNTRLSFLLSLPVSFSHTLTLKSIHLYGQ